jgi:hypothetical protein
VFTGYVDGTPDTVDHHQHCCGVCIIGDGPGDRSKGRYLVRYNRAHEVQQHLCSSRALVGDQRRRLLLRGSSDLESRQEKARWVEHTSEVKCRQ